MVFSALFWQPFQKTGVVVAFFESDGSILAASDCLKMLLGTGVISGASALCSLDLLAFRFSGKFLTSDSVMTRVSINRGCGSPGGGHFFPQSRTLTLNTGLARWL